jgi:hypothetical protein
MAYADAANYNTVKSMRGFPIGAIVPWSGALDTIPVGWISCTGATIPITRFPLLYDAIGNVYGGTAGTTFRLPPLNDGTSAIMDMYQGHFQYLQDKGEAHSPLNTVRSSDSFWSKVGGGDNGNRPSATQTNWISTIDVVGEQIDRPDLVARHEPFELSDGDLSLTISTNERKLSDRHVPNHTHDYDTSESPSYNRRNLCATAWSGQFGGGYACFKSGIRGEGSRSTNDPPVDGRQMNNVGASNRIFTTFRQGGGDIIDDGPLDAQSRATGMSSGDGVSGGDMWAHRAGTRYFWSSLSNSETRFSQTFGHGHGALEYNWTSRIRLINPGIVTDVKMNNVRINNSVGINFGTININSATPTLTMNFIIKAF